MPARPRRITTFLVAIALSAITPLAVIAADKFDDVPDSNIFHDDIAWLADADVTRGYNPPDNTQFCPDDNVTRGQMAAFMNRLANNRVVDAGKLDGKDAIAYTTKIWAASCGVEVAGSPPTPASSCLPSAGGSIGSGLVVEAFRLEADVPAAGALQLSSTAIAGNESLVFGFTIDQACSPDIGVFIDRAVNGHLWGTNQAGYSTAAHLTTAISGGDHIIRLCVMNSHPTDSGGLPTASLSALWAPSETVTVASSDTHAVEMPLNLGG